MEDKLDARLQATIEQVAAWLAEAQRPVAFTGAGISTESGIPDFRSPGGVWSRNTPVYYHQFLASAESRFEYWRQKVEAAQDFVDAKPNAGHLALGRWEQSGRLAGVITQNIDGLHQQAGSKRVVELHGTVRWIECVDCGELFEPLPLIEVFRTQRAVPDCEQCGGRLKSATVLFGQPMPVKAMEQAAQLARESDLFLAIGSSLVVYPAAGLPEIARDHGARVVIINRDPTDQDRSAAAVIRHSIGDTLSRIDQAIQQAGAA
jgi:NAD-dependent deacetylase